MGRRNQHAAHGAIWATGATLTSFSLLLAIVGGATGRAVAADPAPPPPPPAVAAPPTSALPPATTAGSLGTPESLAAGQAAMKAIIAAYGGDAFLAIKTIQATGTGDLRPPGFGIHVPAKAVKLTTISPDRACVTMTTALGQVTVASPGGNKDLWYRFDDVIHDIAAGDLIGDPTAILRIAVAKNYAVRDDGLTPAVDASGKTDGTLLQKLSILDAKGHPTHVLVDTKTHLLRRVESELESEGTMRFDLTDYVSVAGSGVQLPATVISLLNGERVLTLKLKDFTLNQTIDEATFVRPAD